MTGRVSFGEFVLDADTRELRRGSKSVPLSPKAYELLETLVANRPKALSKIAIQETLWPGTFVVEKNVVNLIAEIREALGDDATHPRFVRTVHRFGYSFREAPVDDGPLGAPQARFRLIWAGGREGLGEGEHVLGRDPNLRLFLDAPGVSRRHAVIRIAGELATPKLVLALQHLDGGVSTTFAVARPLPANVAGSVSNVAMQVSAEERAIRSRWQHDAAPPWRAVPPRLICEVRVSNLDAGRWARFPAVFSRWRTDRSAEDCGLDQLSV